MSGKSKLGPKLGSTPKPQKENSQEKKVAGAMAESLEKAGGTKSKASKGRISGTAKNTKGKTKEGSD